MKEHRFHQAGPLRCRTCRARVNTHTRLCTACGEPFVTSRYGTIGKARYEPEPPPSAPAVALAFPDFDELPLGSAA